MNAIKRVTLLLLAGLTASALIAYSVHRNVLGPAQAREEAFEAIKSGKSVAGPDGIVSLPPRWSTASVDGRAYVTKTPEHLMWVLFITERGFGARFTGDLFCDKPAKAMAKGILEINGPGMAPGDPRASSRVTSMEVRVLRVLNPWSFEVSREKP